MDERGKIEIIFGYAEQAMREWLSVVVEQPADELFGEVYEPKREITITEENIIYKLSLSIVRSDYSIDNSYPNSVMEAIGILIYLARQVFPALISTAEAPNAEHRGLNIKEVSLSLDEKTGFLHASYTPEIYQYREVLNRKLMEAKQKGNDEEISKYMREIISIIPRIEAIEDEYDRINSELYNKPHLAVVVEEIIQ